MTPTDIKTAVKRIAKAWKDATITQKDYDNYKSDNSLFKNILCYRYALELCGLTLNEIIALGNASDLDAAIDDLFLKTHFENLKP